MSRETDIDIKPATHSWPAWRPVRAIERRDGLYEILGANPAPESEPWPFGPGDLVRCRPFELTENDIILVAFEKVDRLA